MNLDLLSTVIQMLMAIPNVGPTIVIILKAVLGGSAMVTALVALWQALVICVGALSKVPYLSGLSSMALALQADDAKVEGFLNGVLKPILDRLSLIPLPSASKPALKLAPPPPKVS